MSTALLDAGRHLGHFTIIGSLGRGGMGEVWRARDTVLGREVALKTLPQEFVQDAGRLARFEREARLLAAVSHPNIGAIYGLEKHDDERFLVLELIEGETLAERLYRGALPVTEAGPRSSVSACRRADGCDSSGSIGIDDRER